MIEKRTDKLAADRLSYRWRGMIVETRRSEIFTGDLAGTCKQLANNYLPLINAPSAQSA
jgi:hypothetical protein